MMCDLKCEYSVDDGRVLLKTKSDSIDIHFENVTCTVGFWKKGRQRILKDLSGDFQSGTLTAVMGPSGSGKSTLMDIISGYRLHGVSGRVFVNGKERNISYLRKRSCYIMQDDKLQPLLTVDEAMTFAANVKLHQNSRSNHKQTVRKILHNFSLDEQMNTLTQNLSGGQRKRLAIALELISNPPVLFLDEPTSGLDSKSAKQCVKILRALSLEGRTVVCSIHQPSNLLLELFHNAFILSDGKCIYQGTVNNLVPYLAANDAECPIYHNPAEYVIEICVFASETEVDRLVKSMDNGKSQRWFDNPTCSHSIPLTSGTDNQCNNLEESVRHPTTFSHQFRSILKRKLIIASRDQFLTYLTFAANISVGFALGLFFYNVGDDGNRVFENFNLLFLCLVFVMYNALTSRVITFPLEITIIRREYFNRWYSLKAYYFATIVGDVPIQVLSVTLFLTIVYYFSGQVTEWFRFGLVVFCFVSLALIFQDYGIFVGTLLDVQNGLILGLFSTSPWILFSGFLLYCRDTPVIFQWFFKISMLRKAFEAVVISLYGFGRKKMTCDQIYCHFRYADVFLKHIDVDTENFYWDVGILIVLVFFSKICCYLALKYKISYKK